MKAIPEIVQTELDVNGFIICIYFDLYLFCSV